MPPEEPPVTRVTTGLRDRPINNHPALDRHRVGPVAKPELVRGGHKSLWYRAGGGALDGYAGGGALDGYRENLGAYPDSRGLLGRLGQNVGGVIDS
jgi:hypothetical protein